MRRVIKLVQSKMTGLFAEEAEETNMKTCKASSSGEINVGSQKKLSTGVLLDRHSKNVTTVEGNARGNILL